MQEDALIQSIKDLIESMRPAVQNHQGDIEFIAYAHGTVHLKFHGACVGCPFSFYTLKMGIEEKIKAQLDQVKEVIAVE